MRAATKRGLASRVRLAIEFIGELRERFTHCDSVSDLAPMKMLGTLLSAITFLRYVELNYQVR